MTLRTRSRLVWGFASALVAAGMAMAVGAPGAWGAFGVSPGHFAAGACAGPKPNCEEPDLQAASSPLNTFSTFTLNTNGSGEVEGQLRRVRVDSPAGLVVNPHAIPLCAKVKLEKNECPLSAQIGEEEVTVEAAPKFPVKVKFPVYNVVPPAGAPSDFGYFTGTGVVDIVGGVSWHQELLPGEGPKTPTGDSHEYYMIEGVPQLPPLVSSTLILYGFPEEVTSGGAPDNAFIRIPTSCVGPTSNYLEIESYAGEKKSYSFTPVPPFTLVPLETMNCKAVPFSPGFAVTPETTQSDAPDGAEVVVTVPQNQKPHELASSHLRTAEVKLPEGMTLNPAAGQGLEGCTREQAEITLAKPTIACPPASKIGTAVVETPAVLAPKEPTGEHEGVLAGNIYLGKPASGPITGPPYTIYVTAESAEYGVGVVQEGVIETNEATGQITAKFPENRQSPFSSFRMQFTHGALAPLANPLTCGAATTTASLTGWAGNPASVLTPAFTVDGNGKGGACASPLPFALTQSTEDHPPGGGEATNFTLNLARPDENQYLARASTKLPLGLVGKIPAVPLCPEPNAAAGTCPVASQIGKVAATVGSGPTPARFEGPVYLTGPTEKAPYGMTMVVNAAVGPFSLGNDVVRTRIEVEPYTARVVVAGNVPTIFKGIPLRLKALSVSITRQGFLVNPTNCGALATESTLSSSGGAAQTVSTPFAVTGCSGLAFKPKFGAETNGRTSRANGASMIVHVNRPKGIEANIKSVLVTVPRHMPSRLSTLNHACREAVFAANPANCPKESKVGTARIKTPVLPGQLIGPAYFVSHGGAKFPDLDLVVSGNGVTVILVGNTNISKGITTTRFRALPDVPFSGFELNLPQGPNSALGANGNFCRQSLVMPTTIVAQNGKTIKQNTRIAVNNCPVSVAYRFVRGHEAVVVAHAPAAGRVSGSGPNLRFVTRHTGKAGNVTLYVPLSNAGLRNLAARGRLFVRVRVGFLPKNKKERASVAYTTVVF